ncbi:MAG: YaiI/YqxD family protein [Planctomycetes bacterium]|nr:YaiI/YqxD family protein [Planctomycetota bacterium]
MKIYIDADACPNMVKEVLFRAAIKNEIDLILVANQYIAPNSSPYINSILVGAGDDVADMKIVELCIAGDLVITADIPLADHVVKKKAYALNPRGELYTVDNIKQNLAMRDFMTQLRDTGVETGGPSPFSQKDKHKFANSLDRFLMRYNKPSSKIAKH